MKRIVPFSLNYVVLKRINAVESVALYLSAIIALVILLNDKSLLFTDKEYWSVLLNSLLSFSAVLYFILDILINYLFQLTEVHRKNDLLDNSFDTFLSDKKSEGYYSNESIEKGIYKLGVNCFENSFFSKNVSSAMIPVMLIKSIFILLLFVVLALFTDHKTLSSLMQVALPLTILQQTIRLITYHFRVKAVYEHFKLIFTSVDSKIRDSYLITNVINYETTLAWAGILLDSKKFDALNVPLTKEWEEIKINHKIN